MLPAAAAFSKFRPIAIFKKRSSSTERLTYFTSDLLRNQAFGVSKSQLRAQDLGHQTQAPYVVLHESEGYFYDLQRLKKLDLRYFQYLRRSDKTGVFSSINKDKILVLKMAVNVAQIKGGTCGESIRTFEGTVDQKWRYLRSSY